MSKTTPKAKKLTPQQKAEAFIKEYEALCAKHGFEISVVPQWKHSVDMGDWRLVLRTQVIKRDETIQS